MAQFKTLLIKTDVTALKIVRNDYLFVGNGNSLGLYRISDLKCIRNHDVFCGQKIHGIVPTEDVRKLIVYGGKQIKTFNLSINPNIEVHTGSFQIGANDWILSAIWFKNDSQIALLTAHNIIQIWDVESNVQLQTYRCEEKCILYSGILVDLGTNVLAMAGTVFSQVVIWSTVDEFFIHKLTGHNGVIFSISYSALKNIIVTTSDDRTVRIWNINNSKSDYKNIDYWKSVNISLKVTIFGHTARVMRNIILENNIVSIGEDSFMCTWDLNGNLINKQKIHQDGCVWCIDYNNINDVIVTGGSDSGVLIHPLSSNLKSKNEELKKLPDLGGTESPKKIVITFRGNIVCLTEKGKLYYHDLEIGIWSEKYVTNAIHSNMAVSKCRQLIALSNINGDLDIIAETCKFEPNLINCLSQRITKNNLLSLHWLANRNIIICEKEGILSILSACGQRCSRKDEFYLPNCKERWLTVASEFYKPIYSLVVGDRCGNIHVYDKSSVHPIQTITKVHGRLGTNSINSVEDKIMTTGRDGTLKCFKLIIVNDKPQLNFLHSIKYPFNWIERFVEKTEFICGFRESQFFVWNVKENSSIFELNCGGGHRSWDINKIWHKINDESTPSLLFVFIKNSSMHIIDYSVNNVSKSIIKGTHIREINALQIIPCNSKSTEITNCSIITAGEDTTIRVHNVHKDMTTFHFKEESIIRKHLSSIRCMCIKKMKDRSKSILFSAGGRAQICAWLCVSQNESTECYEMGNYMLKGSDLERKGNIGWKQVEIDMDPETRLMSLVCFDPDELDLSIDSKNICDYLLLAGCSDGFLRLYSVTITNDNKCDIILKDSFKYLMKCILKIHFVKLNSAIIILTMYTNGVVAFWNLTSYLNQTNSFQPFYEIKLHKAGINSFDLKRLDDDNILLVTGGDDNDLQVNVISIEINQTRRDKGRLLSKWSSYKYHCAQITGIKLIDDKYVLSTSIDQRLTVFVWIFDKISTIVDCTYLDQYHVNVPDVQGMDVFHLNGKEVNVCVYGKGIEFVTIDLP